MEREKTSHCRKTKSGINYSNLGQFRVTSVQESPPPPLVLNTPESIVRAWTDLVIPSPWFDRDKEHMVVFVLNARLTLKGWNLVSIGSLSETCCHPREVIRPVIVAAGHGFVVAHNHPSLDPSPSRADETTTRRLSEAAAMLQVTMLDHVVIGGGSSYFSFREAGMI